MSGAAGGGIFVSYRRQDTDHLAGRLYDRLADRFGEDRVFMDVDKIEPGVDFAEEISQAVAACQVLVAVVGPAWLTATDERGRRRLDDPGDFVRLEIETALTRDVRVIPVLAQGAVMPGQDDLPERLAGLARRNALVIRHESFRSDAGRLVAAIEQVLALAPGLAPSPVALDAQGSRRSDLTRAARLLTDAEYIASSLTDKALKAWALSDIAQVLAAVGSDRAARLLTDAEAIARSLPKESSQAEVLSRIAQALGAVDSDQAARLLTDAEAIARSLTKESLQALVLSRIAQVVAATDPDRAARLLTDAEDIARPLIHTFDPSPAKVLSSIVEALSALDSDRAARLLTDAEDIARSLTDDPAKVEVLSDIAQLLAATDPNRAARLVTDAEGIARSPFFFKSWTVSGLSHIAQTLAATDPERAAQLLIDAEAIVRSRTNDEPSKNWALSRVAQVLAATDPDRAEDIARSLTDDEPLQASVLSRVAQVVAATDPDRAARLLAEAVYIARSLTDESEKAEVLSDIVQALEGFT
jgi:hypothetical protein